MIAGSDSERTGPKPGVTGRALVPFSPVASAPVRAFAWPAARYGLLVAAFGLALGIGAAGFQGARHAVAAWAGPTRPDPQSALLHHLQDEVGRLQSSVDALRAVADTAGKADEPLRGLKRSVEALKQDVEQVRSSGSASLAQLAAKIDRADHDPNPRLAEIAARLDRIEHATVAKVADAQGQKVADLAGRVDRIEKQVAAPAPTGSLPAPAGHPAAVQALAAKPAITAPVKPEVTQVAPADPRVAPKVAAIDNWVLRDVYDGVALVQARGGGLREVQPGEYLPGAGEVRSIERRGRNWVVLTSRGVIDDATF